MIHRNSASHVEEMASQLAEGKVIEARAEGFCVGPIERNRVRPHAPTSRPPRIINLLPVTASTICINGALHSFST